MQKGGISNKKLNLIISTERKKLFPQKDISTSFSTMQWVSSHLSILLFLTNNRNVIELKEERFEELKQDESRNVFFLFQSSYFIPMLPCKFSFSSVESIFLPGRSILQCFGNNLLIDRDNVQQGELTIFNILLTNIQGVTKRQTNTWGLYTVICNIMIGNFVPNFQNNLGEMNLLKKIFVFSSMKNHMQIKDFIFLS